MSSALSEAGAQLAPEALLRQAATENFPVALWLLGSRTRQDLMAIYGFARLIDDIGDEVEGDRLGLLDWAEGQLDRIYAGEPVAHPLLRRLAATVAARSLPRDPLCRLIEANRQDQSVARYETFEDLLAYCSLSAAPVGELVLHVFGQATPDRVAQSDRVCAGLQVVEHLQDVAEDFARGRVYLPQVDLRKFGCAEEDLGRASASPALRALAAFEGERARVLLDAGPPLAATLPPAPRLAVAGFVAGGRAALVALRRTGFNVCAAPPRATRRRFVIAFARAVAGR